MMEEFRPKRCLVLPVVFALALGITLGCKPPASDKSAVAEKKAEKPSAPAEESKAQTEGDVAKSDKSKAETKGKVLPPQPQTPAPKTPAAKRPAVKVDTPEAKKPVDTPKNAKAASPAAKTAKTTPSEPELDDEIPRDETPQETAKRLGPPLVDQPDKLVQLDPVHSIWLDKPGGRMVMVGEVCQRRAPLEMFVCLWHTKEHEAVLTARVPAKVAHTGLLALGAEAINPVQFMPKYVPAAGSVIDIEVIWKDAKGKVQKRRAQDWIRNFRTKKPMQGDWVFGGSGFWTDKKTGIKHYQAASGDFICVSNFSTAMLDLPVKSTDSNEGLMFEAMTDNIPPLGTPVTIVLKPRLKKSGK